MILRYIIRFDHLCIYARSTHIRKHGFTLFSFFLVETEHISRVFANVPSIARVDTKKVVESILISNYQPWFKTDLVTWIYFIEWTSSENSHPIWFIIARWDVGIETSILIPFIVLSFIDVHWACLSSGLLRWTHGSAWVSFPTFWIRGQQDSGSKFLIAKFMQAILSNFWVYAQSDEWLIQFDCRWVKSALP